MSSAAKKLVVVQNNEPAAEAAPAPSRATGGIAAARSLAVRGGRAARRGDAGAQASRRRQREERRLRSFATSTRRAASILCASARSGPSAPPTDLSWLLTKQIVETRKLSRAAVETLAIVAYHQPVTRAEIEEIRGVVTAAGTLDVLLKTGWIRPRGRRKAPGPSDHLRNDRSVPVAFRSGGGRRSAGPRRTQGRRADRGQSASRFCRAAAFRRFNVARRRRSAGAGRSRSGPGAAVLAFREVTALGNKPGHDNLKNPATR